MGRRGRTSSTSRGDAFDYPPGATTEAEASTFATEGDQPLGAAILAPEPHEAMLRDTALVRWRANRHSGLVVVLRGAAGRALAAGDVGRGTGVLLLALWKEQCCRLPFSQP